MAKAKIVRIMWLTKAEVHDLKVLAASGKEHLTNHKSHWINQWKRTNDIHNLYRRIEAL